MKTLEEYLVENDVDYTIKDDVLIINGELIICNYLIEDGIKFPKKVIINGALDLEECENIILSEYLEVDGYIDLSSSKNITLPKVMKCNRWADISNSDIKKLPKTLKITDNFYISDNFNINLLSNSLKLKSMISIKNKCKWKLLLNSSTLDIGCKTKTIEEWEVFFANNEFYATHPDTEEYQKIKEAFEYAKTIYNTVLK